MRSTVVISEVERDRAAALMLSVAGTVLPSLEDCPFDGVGGCGGGRGGRDDVGLGMVSDNVLVPGELLIGAVDADELD